MISNAKTLGFRSEKELNNGAEKLTKLAQTNAIKKGFNTPKFRNEILRNSLI